MTGDATIRNFTHLLLLLLTSTASFADWEVWSHDLTELPPAWTESNVIFTPDGAHLNVECWCVPNGTKSLPSSAYLLTDILIVPPGLDSLVIDVSQSVYASAWSSQYPKGSASAFAVLSAEINECTDVELWKRGVIVWDDSSSSITDSLHIHAVITSLVPGDLLRIRFSASASALYGEGTVDWLIWDAQLIGYGPLSLIPRTWAGIKSLF